MCYIFNKIIANFFYCAQFFVIVWEKKREKNEKKNEKKNEI